MSDEPCHAPDPKLEAIRKRWAAKLHERANCLALGFETGGMAHDPMGLVVYVLAGGRYISEILPAELIDRAADTDEMVSGLIWVAVRRLHKKLREERR